jgi:putative drug exporter of the RND superfamily
VSEKYAKFIAKFKWLIIAFWVVLTVTTVLWSPQLKTVVSHQSTTFLPNDAGAVTAQNLANQVNPKYKAKSTVIVAIHDASGLSQADKAFFLNKLSNINQNPGEYQATYVEDTANVSSDVAKQFVSHDRTTEIATVGLSADISDPNLSSALNHIKSAFADAPVSAKVYFTGDVPIQLDDIQLSQAGADKTAVVTVSLVLIILLAVFRSIVTPLITLLSIGLSYVISAGAVAIAAEHGLPISTFTQTFLIAVLFGAGTDYSIILLNRFREELTRSHEETAALASALRGVGKTVMFSSLTVLISFAVLYFAKFGLYRSAVGVAVGIFITLLVCLTLIPALMSLLGGYLYWPQKPKPGMHHRPSRFWAATASVSTRKPWQVLLILLVVLAPVALLFSNERTFDPTQDIPFAPSVQGFQTVTKAFGAGQAMPTNVILQTTDNLRSQNGLATIAEVTDALSAVNGVKEIYSATQPLGTIEKGFQLANQNTLAAGGLGQVSQGLSKLSGQLGSGSKQTSHAVSALSQLQSGSSQVTLGAAKISTGASGLANGLQSVQSGLNKANSGANSLSQGVSQVSKSAGSLAKGASSLASSEQKLSTASQGLADALSAWAASHPDAKVDPNWVQIMALASQLQQGTSAATDASQQIAKGTNQLAAGLPGLQQGAKSIASATNQLSGGIGKLTSAAKSLASGANNLSSGSRQVTGGITAFQSELGSLSSGLSQASNVSLRLQSGVLSVQTYLNQTKQAATKGNPGFFVPNSTISNNKNLQQAMDAYISPDGHLAKWTVILKQSPYSMQAIQEIPTLRQAAYSGLKLGPMSTGEFYLGGTTATQAEMNQLSSGDFTRTMILIFCSIFILLVLMLRSILAPLYILLSLCATYFVTMGILQTIAIRVLHHNGIGWAVPFFVLLLLVALGVDYSIFLMSRFDEVQKSGLHPIEAMRESMAQMGNVIFSAAFIMMGTFGSLTIAGITTTTEIGLAVIIGLFLYAAILLAFFIPASAAIMGEAHYWPFEMNIRRENPVSQKHRLRSREQE